MASNAPSEFVERVADLVSQVACQITGRIREFDPAEDLFASGWFDSVNKFHLVLAIQDEFGVVLDHDEISRQSLSTIETIADTLASKSSP